MYITFIMIIGGYMTSFPDEIKKKALEAGFISVGITNPESMQDLPYGWVADVKNLRPPK